MQIKMLEQTIENLQNQNKLLKDFAHFAQKEDAEAVLARATGSPRNHLTAMEMAVRPESSVGRWWDERGPSPCNEQYAAEDEESDDSLGDEELSDDETNEQASPIDAQTKGDMLATISKVFGDGPQRSTSPDTQVHEELGMKQSPHDKLDVVFDWHSPRVSDASETQVTSPTSAWLGQVRRACTCTRTQASPHATAQHGTALHGMEWCSVAHGLHAHMHARTHARTHACMHARMHSGL